MSRHLIVMIRAEVAAWLEQAQLTRHAAAVLTDVLKSAEPKSNVWAHVHAAGVHANRHGVIPRVVCDIPDGVAPAPPQLLHCGCPSERHGCRHLSSDLTQAPSSYLGAFVVFQSAHSDSSSFSAGAAVCISAVCFFQWPMYAVSMV